MKNPLYLAIVAIGIIVLSIILTSPVESLLGKTKYALPGAIHGGIAILYFISATLLLYLSYQLFTNKLNDYNELRLVSLVSSILSFLTILFGAWIYIFYREKNSVRAWFIENMPEIHKIFFEFKEMIALFTFPLTLTVFFILLVNDKKAFESNKKLATVVFILTLLAWIYMAIPFMLGAAITKIKSI